MERPADNEAIQRTKAAVFGALAEGRHTQACVKFKEESGHGHIERAVARRTAVRIVSGDND